MGFFKIWGWDKFIFADKILLAKNSLITNMRISLFYQQIKRHFDN